MNTTTTSSQAPLILLPQDLKALIFEYIPVDDYVALALTCKNLNSLLNLRSDLWTKHLYRDFLGVTEKDRLYLDEDLAFGSAGSEEAVTQEIADSKKLLTEHYNIRRGWRTLFSKLLVPESREIFLEEVFQGLMTPSSPAPSLKKDAHNFLTNTLFQNFLTEVHFGVQGRSIFPDRRKNVVEVMARQIETDLLGKRMNTDNLVDLRWYQKVGQQGKLVCSKASLINSRTKTIRKWSQARERPSSRRCQKEKKEEDSTKRYVEQQGKLMREEENHVETFYNMLRLITENYCKMASAYLRTIQDPYLLLNEYTRLWNRFASMTINFSQVFAPFSSLLNKLYQEECGQMPSFPEFSTWRFLVKIWISEVYSSLNYFLGESCRGVLMRLRGNEHVSMMKFTEDCAHMTEEGPKSLYREFFYNRSMKSGGAELTREAVMKLLKRFSDALDDISYNEYTIFFWDCSKLGKGTPKEMLEGFVLEDSRLIYEQFKDCLGHDVESFGETLKSDLVILEGVFGKLLTSSVMKAQEGFIKDILYEVLGKALEEAKRSAHRVSPFRDDSVYSPNGADLDVLLRNLGVDKEMHDEISRDEARRKAVADILSNEKKLVSECLGYLNKVEQGREEQEKENEEEKCHRYLRGFTCVDEKYWNLLELGRNPSLGEVIRIGLEGKNIKEEVDSFEDDIVFLL